jgi:hypothetical protein
MVLVCFCEGIGWEVEPVFGEILEDLARYGCVVLGCVAGKCRRALLVVVHMCELLAEQLAIGALEMSTLTLLTPICRWTITF